MAETVQETEVFGTETAFQDKVSTIICSFDINAGCSNEGYVHFVINCYNFSSYA